MRNTNVQGQQNINQIDAIVNLFSVNFFIFFLNFILQDIFVLLDLIGHKDVQFGNSFDRTTGKYYNRLRDIGLLFRKNCILNTYYLYRKWTSSFL
jgi:hypothetical protein